MKIKDVILENAERPYVCVHAKKGKCEVTANSSYAAAKKAADKWKLKSTAGIDAYLADVKHTAVNEAKGFTKEIHFDEYDQEEAFFYVFDPYRKSINKKLTPEAVVSSGSPLIKINVEGGSFSIYKYDKYIISVTEVGGEDPYVELINVPDTATLSKIIKKANKAADRANSSSSSGGFGYYGSSMYEAKEIDVWDDQDEYEEEDNPYKASGLPNIVMQIEKAQDLIKGFADEPKFKKPVLKFVDDMATVVSDAEYSKNKDKKTIPEKYLKLFMDQYSKLKSKTQMQNDAIMSRKGFIGAIKNSMDGKYGGAAEKSPYSGMMRSKSSTTSYT